MINTLMSTIASVSTTAIKELVSARTGAIYRPWIKLSFKRSENDKKEE
jgi:hypothetical protein